MVSQPRASPEPAEQRRMIDAELDAATADRPLRRDPHPPFTLRELDVLARVAAGKSTREIAERLGITKGTVSSHVSTILEKLGTRSRVQAAAHALRRGWITVEQEGA